MPDQHDRLPPLPPNVPLKPLERIVFNRPAHPTISPTSDGLHVEADVSPFLEGVLREFRLRTQHPLSSGMPHDPNLEASYTPYQAYLDAYIHAGDDTAEEKKWDFEKDPNIGWKLHLNVSPKHVVHVSQYLKAQGYNHKFLSGGDPENGKIFTR